MRTAKFIVGLICLALAVTLPGCLALGIGTNFGFGRVSSEMVWRDILRALPFAVCAVGLAAAGSFLLLNRRSSLSYRARILISVAALAGVIPAIVMIADLRARRVDAAEDKRRWLREIDRENDKAGFVKDSTGAWTVVARTNNEPAAKLDPSK